MVRLLMGQKHLCFFQTAETGKRIRNSSVKGSGANHYPRAADVPYSSTDRNPQRARDVHPNILTLI